MNVTIKGSNLSKVTSIKIGPGISTAVTVVSDTEIQGKFLLYDAYRRDTKIEFISYCA